MPTVAVENLTRYVTRIFVACGLDEASAAAVAEHLVDAEADGITSHGVIRVPQYVDAIEQKKIALDAQLRVVRESASTAVLDGGHGLGQIMARQAMDVAVNKARQSGMAGVTLVNCSHTGRLASYTRQAAVAGMIGIVMVNAGGSGQWVAPFGGREGRLSTNPISIAIPSGDRPLLLIDFATSAAPEGKVRAHLTSNKPLPDGWIVDHAGNVSTNPADLYGPPRGAILPFGGAQGYKGFSLALFVDVLAGALSGAGVCRADAPHDSTTDGVFSMAIDVSHFCTPAAFAEYVEQLTQHVKSSQPMSGFTQVVLPGEPEVAACSRALLSGIAIDAGVWQSLVACGQRLGIAFM